jgi:redox-sensitive bicupin YhaK (pirin superfamily)
MIMNAGRSFWHEERVGSDDAPLRMLQIFVRPHTVDLEPHIQHGPIPAPVIGQWRHLFGPGSEPAGGDVTDTHAATSADGDAPFTVRGAVHLYDLRLDDGTVAELPHLPGWHTYFHVFTGEALVDGERFGQAQSGLITADAPHVPVTANQPTTVVAFLIDPNAPVTKVGTVGR